MSNQYVEQILNALRSAFKEGEIPDPQIMQSDAGDVLFHLHYIPKKFNPNIYMNVKITNDQTEQVIQEQGYVTFQLTYHFNHYRMSPSEILTTKFFYHYALDDLANKDLDIVYYLTYSLLDLPLERLFHVGKKTDYLYTVIQDATCSGNLDEFIKKYASKGIDDKIIPLRGLVDDNRSIMINQVLHGGVKLDDYQVEPMTLPNLMVLGENGENTLHLPDGRIIQNPIVNMDEERKFILDLLGLPRNSNHPQITLSSFMRYLITKGYIYRDNDLSILQLETIVRAIKEVKEHNRKITRAFTENFIETILPRSLKSDEYTISKPYRRFDEINEEVRFTVKHHPTDKYGTFVLTMRVSEHDGISVSKLIPERIDVISGEKGVEMNRPLITEEGSMSMITDYINANLFSPKEVLASFTTASKYAWTPSYTMANRNECFLGYSCSGRQYGRSGDYFEITPVIRYYPDDHYHVHHVVSIIQQSEGRPSLVKMWFKHKCNGNLSIQDALIEGINKSLPQIEAFIDKALSVDWNTTRYYQI